MIEKLEGIVLSCKDYSETSKLLSIITKKYGIISVIAKGARNLKSDLRSSSDKLTYGYFNVYYKEQGVSTLISIDIINSFSKILMDLEKISYASYILDLTTQVVRQTDSKEVFSILRDTLIKLEEGLSPIILTNIIEIKLLDYLGVSPNIDSCSICGSNKNIVTLSSSAGGYVCSSCYTNEYIVSEKTIKIVRMYYYVDIKNIKKLEVSPLVTKEINIFLNDYYDRYTGLYIKSKDFIKKLIRLPKYNKKLIYNYHVINYIKIKTLFYV